MNIGNTNVEVSINSPFGESMDLMIGVSLEDGYTECCSNPIMLLRIGLLILTVTIIMQPINKQ